MIRYEQRSRMAVCPGMVYTVFGRRHNFELSYPLCGGRSGLLGGDGAERYLLDLISTFSMEDRWP